MKTTDVPHLKEPMTSPKRAPKPADTVTEPVSTGEYARASETSDPAVHQILAEMQTARSNGDDDAVAELTKALNSLGYQ